MFCVKRVNSSLNTHLSSATFFPLMAQSKQTFSDLGQDRVNFAREEEKILKYWHDIDAFKQQLKLTEGQKPWTFYELRDIENLCLCCSVW